MPDDTAVIVDSATTQANQTAAANATPAANQADSANANAAPASEPTANANGSEPSKPLGDKGVQELIDQRRKRQQAEQEAAYWRGVAEAGKQQPQQQQWQAQGPPKLEDFENYDDYLVAKAKFEIRQEMASQTVATSFRSRVLEAAKKNPDIMTVLEDRSIPISAPMADAIQESEMGPEIAYHLKQNPAEAERIAYLSPVAAIREIGKIEAKLTMPQPPTTTQRISQAPEPIKALGGGGAVTETDLDKVSIDEFMKKRNAETAKRR